MISWARRHPLVAVLTLLVLFWAFELWFIQDCVLQDPFKPPKNVPLRQWLRFGLDVSLIALLVFVLPRRALYVLFCAEFVVFILGGVYYDYYGRLPRLTMVTGQAGEGAAIVPLVLGMIKPLRAAALLAAIAFKVVLLQLVGRADRSLNDVVKRWASIGSGTAYAGVLVAAYLVDPLTQMKLWGTTARFGMTYGFAIPLTVEAYYAQSGTMLSRALESARKSTNRLTGVEENISPFDRIVFLQVESLDYGVIDKIDDGVEITPNLNRLRHSSMFFKAEAAHFTGSADADFVALMGRWPSRDIVTYKIQDYPFGGALPHTLRKYGYDSTAIHGVSGGFFDRRPAYSKMGFDHLVFREELRTLGVPARYSKYDWIQDAELLDYAAKRLKSSPPKSFQLIITVTSHSPFQQLPPEESAKCRRYSDIADQYFCSMSYVDRAIGHYVEALPDETTLVIYGDHDSSVTKPGYDSGRRGDRDWVPVFVYNKPGNLASMQTTLNRGALDGAYTFVDVLQYLHGQIRRNHDAGGTRATTASTFP